MIEIASKTQEIPRLILRHQDAMIVNRIESPITFICVFELFLLSINAHKLKIRRSLWDAESLSPPATKTGISIESFYLIQQIGSPKLVIGRTDSERSFEMQDWTFERKFPRESLH